MRHKIWYDDENEVSVLELIGDFLSSDLEPMLNGLKEILEGKPYQQVIVDMSTKSKAPNRETREGLNKGLSEQNITEIAFVGFNATGRMTAKVLLKTGVLKIKGDFFKNKEEAINWIKKNR